MIDKEQRRIYVERYSKEQVALACAKASRHRARAIKWGCTDAHFTAWEWLDLCNASGFCCSYCRENVPLEPHHVHELYLGGANTINNIMALCKTCHDYWHTFPDDVSDLWMAEKQRLLDSFSEGEWVRRPSYRQRQGRIIQLFPLQRPALPLRGTIFSGTSAQSGKTGHRIEHGIGRGGRPMNESASRKFTSDIAQAWWEAAPKALIQWLRVVDGSEVVIEEVVVNLCDVEKVPEKT